MKVQSKRATIYFDPLLFKALQIKAVEVDSSVSEIVSLAIKHYLSEDLEDLSAFNTRSKEPGVSFEQVVKKLKRDGKI